MLSREEETDLTKELGKVRKEIVDLGRELTLVDEEKEAAFENKEKYDNGIDEAIKKIRLLKAGRDSLISQIKGDKELRKVLNTEFRQNVLKIKEVRESQRALIEKHGISDPSRIKGTIKDMEYKIETEAMSFEKEKELMKKIKVLKKKSGEVSVLYGLGKEISDNSKDLNILKDGSNDVHQKIQSRALTAQNKHEEFIAIIKGIDELKKKKSEWLQKFFKLKMKYTTVNAALKEKLGVMNGLNKKYRENVQGKKEKKEEIIKEQLKSKEEIVQNKMKNGEKLTNEDLLVFQAEV
tara:strand:- start:1924 stop:2805 length:882 start_codon:yes stop_codon:yes gene_type:complete